MKAYVQERKADVATVLADYQLLTEAIAQLGWDLLEEYQPDHMKRPLAELPGISDRCKKKITNAYFNRSVERRREDGDLGQRPFTLKDVLTRTTSLDWTILDLFYRLSGFAYFKRMFDLAEQGIDKGPICNMALLSKYLSKFVELYSLVLTAGFLSENKFRYLFFMSFLYTVYRRGESEFENEDDPFPKGRIPFLTIHQAKGLELLCNPHSLH